MYNRLSVIKKKLIEKSSLAGLTLSKKAFAFFFYFRLVNQARRNVE